MFSYFLSCRELHLCNINIFSASKIVLVVYDEYFLLFYKKKHGNLGSLQPTNLKTMPFDYQLSYETDRVEKETDWRA